MRILHYSLGFPPYRSGGMIKFCMDLMEEQVKCGNEVSLLWPGEIRLLGHKTHIMSRARYGEIQSYEIINPLPVSYDEGIQAFNAFTAEGDKEVYASFLRMLKPDVIHVHTLMGLHKNFLSAAKDRGIQVVFTAHDFFPICPKVTLFRHGQICDCAQSCEQCAKCNSTALSLQKLAVLQSPIYRKFKNTVIIKALRKQHRDSFLGDDRDQEPGRIAGLAEDYQNLRNYYKSILSIVDVVHFNSTVTQRVYEQFFSLPNGRVISITHSAISDHRKTKLFSPSLMRIRYLGPQSEAKGFYLLKTALDELWKTRHDFCLDIHFSPVERSPYMNIHPRYSYNELEQIFDETDVLIAPSLLCETFGYTVLEALSYGVPAIISGNVGAKDILVAGTGIIIDDISSDKLLNTFKTLTPETLSEMNRTICEKQEIMTIQKMSTLILKECYLEG